MKVYNRIKTINVNKIKPYFNNPRENDKTVQALVKSISKVGFNVPLVIDKDYTIIKGHSRYCAAKELGLKKLPCIISEATDKENNADRLFDNAIQELSKWDPEKLLVELRDLDFRIDDVNFNIPSENMAKLYASGDVTKEDMENALKGFTDDKQKKHIKFVCPNCGEESFLSKEEIDILL